MIQIQNVSRRFGRQTAVNDVSLGIASGDSVALWGANGAGKTTLLRCVLGLLRFTGRITVGGFDVRRQGKQSRILIGYVPQELGFYDDLRVSEAVLFFARLKGLPPPTIERMLEGVGLGGNAAKRIRELSGGMKQRLALGIAMLGDPSVLVLDEVTASLDACGRKEFVSLLKGLAGSGRTVLFASHRLDEVATLARRVVVMDRGRIVSVSETDRFIQQLGQGTMLHLTLPLGVREQAMTVLQAGGFSPRYNGVGVYVPVPTEQKAAPFRLLADARITIEDFEVVSATATGSAGHQEGVQS